MRGCTRRVQGLRDARIEHMKTSVRPRVKPVCLDIVWLA